MECLIVDETSFESFSQEWLKLEEIKKQTKPSIVEALRRGMEEQRKKDSEKQAQEKQKKQNMEL